MLRSSWILNERNLSYKLVKNCTIIGLKTRRGKTNSVRGLYDKKQHTGIALFSSDLMNKNTDKRYI